MSEINLIGGFYKSKTLPWSAQDVVNWLPVKSLSGGTRSPYKLRGAPGLRPLGASAVDSLEIIGDAPSGVVGDSYSFSYSAAGGVPPYTFSFVSGSLPAGLSFSAGSISGTPSAVGVSSFRVGVTDASAQVAQKDDEITISAPPVVGRFFITRTSGGSPSSVEYVTTTDPTNWTTGIVTPTVAAGDYQISSASYANGAVIFADNIAGNIFASFDSGASWTRGSMPASSGGNGKIVFAQGNFVLPAQVAGINASTGGLTYSRVNTTDRIVAVSMAGTVIVGGAAGDFDYSKTRYSTNGGVSWTQAATELGTEWGWGNITIFGNGTRVFVHGFKAGSLNNNIGGYTENGNTFVQVSSPFASGNRSTCGAASGSLFVMGSQDGTIAYSTNSGATWNIAANSLGVRANDVAVTGGVFAMVGNGGVLKTSTDGNTWTTRTTSFGSSDIFTITAIQ